MKNYINILSAVALLLLFSSCGAADRAMQRSVDKLDIGMSIEDFREVMRGASVVYMSDEYSAFVVRKSRIRYGYGPVYSTRFFYFKDNKLWRMDEGSRAVDYRIQVDG